MKDDNQINEMRKLIEAVDFDGSEYETAINILVKYVHEQLAAEGATSEDGDALSDIINEIGQDIWDNT